MEKKKYINRIIFCVVILAVILTYVLITSHKNKINNIEEEKQASLEAERVVKIQNISLEYNAMNPYEKLKSSSVSENYWEDYYTFEVQKAFITPDNNPVYLLFDGEYEIQKSDIDDVVLENNEYIIYYEDFFNNFTFKLKCTENQVMAILNNEAFVFIAKIESINRIINYYAENYADDHGDNLCIESEKAVLIEGILVDYAILE